MSNFCACNGTLINTGVPNKQRAVSSGVKMFAVLMKADDGVGNAILTTDTIDQVFIDAKVNNVDASKRWYPIGTFQDEADVRADAATQSFTNGSSSIVQQGVRSYSGMLVGYAPKYISNLAGLRCFNFGIYVVDACGALIGSISKDETKLKPIRVNKDSWNPTYVKGTPSVAASVMLAFEFSQIERDEYLRVISEIEITGDLLSADGLLELKGTPSNEALTGFDLALNVDYDEFLDASKTLVPNWVVGDFIATNSTTGLTIVITSVTETTTGVYTFVFAAQSSGDVVNVKNLLTAKPGFNLDVNVTLP